MGRRPVEFCFNIAFLALLTLTVRRAMLMIHLVAQILALLEGPLLAFSPKVYRNRPALKAFLRSTGSKMYQLPQLDPSQSSRGPRKFLIMPAGQPRLLLYQRPRAPGCQHRVQSSVDRRVNYPISVSSSSSHSISSNIEEPPKPEGGSDPSATKACS